MLVIRSFKIDAVYQLWSWHGDWNLGVLIQDPHSFIRLATDRGPEFIECGLSSVSAILDLSRIFFLKKKSCLNDIMIGHWANSFGLSINGFFPSFHLSLPFPSYGNDNLSLLPLLFSFNAFNYSVMFTSDYIRGIFLFFRAISSDTETVPFLIFKFDGFSSLKFMFDRLKIF